MLLFHFPFSFFHLTKGLLQNAKEMRSPWLHRRGGPCALPAAASCMNGKNVRRIRTICEFAEHFLRVYCCAAGRGRAAAPTKSGTHFSAHPYFATDPPMGDSNVQPHMPVACA